MYGLKVRASKSNEGITQTQSIHAHHACTLRETPLKETKTHAKRRLSQLMSPPSPTPPSRMPRMPPITTLRFIRALFSRAGEVELADLVP